MKMDKKRKSYEQEFKQLIADLYYRGKSVSELSDKYGIPRGTLYTWIKKSERRVVTQEYKELKSKIQKLEYENRILKEVTAIFANNQ